MYSEFEKAYTSIYLLHSSSLLQYGHALYMPTKPDRISISMNLI